MAGRVRKVAATTGAIVAMILATAGGAYLAPSLLSQGSAAHGRDYCQTFYEGVNPSSSMRSSVGTDHPLRRLALGAGGPAELRHLFKEMASVAPKKVYEATALLSTAGVDSSQRPVTDRAAFEAIDSFLGRNCPIDSPLAMQIILDQRSQASR